jgi:hypothetical protein
MRWWHFGLIGGLALSVVTAGNVLKAVLAGAAIREEWPQIAGFAAAVFGMGFLCGVIVWARRGLYRRLGMAGDTIVGVAVMVCFFLSCMVLFDREALGVKFRSEGAPMLGLAVVIGLIGGAWLGHDLRKDSAEQQRERADGGDEGGRPRGPADAGQVATGDRPRE